MTRETTRQFWLEARSFWGEAFAWQGAATPRVLPPVAVFGVIAAIVYGVSRIWPCIGIPVARPRDRRRHTRPDPRGPDQCRL